MSKLLNGKQVAFLLLISVISLCIVGVFSILVSTHHANAASTPLPSKETVKTNKAEPREATTEIVFAEGQKGQVWFGETGYEIAPINHVIWYNKSENVQTILSDQPDIAPVLVKPAQKARLDLSRAAFYTFWLKSNPQATVSLSVGTYEVPVPDPNLISLLSAHKDGSQATFSEEKHTISVGTSIHWENLTGQEQRIYDEQGQHVYTVPSGEKVVRLFDHIGTYRFFLQSASKSTLTIIVV